MLGAICSYVFMVSHALCYYVLRLLSSGAARQTVVHVVFASNEVQIRFVSRAFVQLFSISSEIPVFMICTCVVRIARNFRHGIGFTIALTQSGVPFLEIAVQFWVVGFVLLSDSFEGAALLRELTGESMRYNNKGHIELRNKHAVVLHKQVVSSVLKPHYILLVH